MKTKKDITKKDIYNLTIMEDRQVQKICLTTLGRNSNGDYKIIELDNEDLPDFNIKGGKLRVYYTESSSECTPKNMICEFKSMKQCQKWLETVAKKC